MSQLSEGLGLYLPYPFAGDIEFFSHFLQSPGSAVFQTESQLEHLLLSLGKSPQYIYELFIQPGESCRLSRIRGVVVRDKISQMAVLFLSDRGLQGNRLL